MPAPAHALARGELTNEHYVAQALDLGAHGYLFKNALPPELLHSLGTVAAGRPFVCSALGLFLLNWRYLIRVVSKLVYTL